MFLLGIWVVMTGLVVVASTVIAAMERAEEMNQCEN